MKHPPDVSAIAGGNCDLKPVGGGGVSRATLLERAKAMRNNPTEPEKRFWNALRNSRFQGWKFRRQHVFGMRIIDFYCPAAKLVIEVDGDTHDREIDARRDRSLSQNRGMRTLRFTNTDVMNNLNGVLTILSEALRRSNHPQTPSLSKEGEAQPKAPSSLEEGIVGGGCEAL